MVAMVRWHQALLVGLLLLRSWQGAAGEGGAAKPERKCVKCENSQSLSTLEHWLDPDANYKYPFHHASYGYPPKESYKIENKQQYQELYFLNGAMLAKGSMVQKFGVPVVPRFPRLKYPIYLNTQIKTSWVKVDGVYSSPYTPKLGYTSEEIGTSSHYMILSKRENPRYNRLFPLYAPEDSIAVLWTQEYIQLQTQMLSPPFACNHPEVDLSIKLTLEGIEFSSTCGSYSMGWEEAGVKDVTESTVWYAYLGADCDGRHCKTQSTWSGINCFQLEGTQEIKEHTGSSFLASIPSMDTKHEEKCSYGLPDRPQFIGPGNAHYLQACRGKICANTPVRTDPYITLDLGHYSHVQHVVLKNSIDGEFLQNFELRIGDSEIGLENELCPLFKAITIPPGVRMTFPCNGYGRFLTLRQLGDCSALKICELLPFGKKSRRCGGLTPKSMKSAELESEIVFTEVTQSHEAIAAHWDGALGYPRAGTIFFRGDVLFSRPVQTIDAHDIQVAPGRILKVHLAKDDCSAEFYGFLQPPYCEAPYTDTIQYICMQLKAGIPELFYGYKKFPEGELYCVEIPDYESLACQRAHLSPASQMHMTSKGPVTTEEHVLITVQTSFSAYINENWLTIKGPYGSSVESIKAAEVKNTYYVGIGLHYPAGKTKVCFNDQYLGHLRMYPVSCLTITKLPYTAYDGPVISTSTELKALDPYLEDHIHAIGYRPHAKLPEHAIIAGIGQKYQHRATSDYFAQSEQLLHREETINSKGRKLSIFDILQQGFHDVASEKGGPQSAIDKVMGHYHKYHTPSVRSKRAQGRVQDNFGWARLQGTPIEDAFRKLVKTSEPSESLPDLLKGLGFIPDESTVTGNILGYDALLVCMDLAKGDEGNSINGVTLLLCPHLPGFLRPTIGSLLHHRDDPLMDPSEVLEALLPNESTANEILESQWHQSLIQELFNKCAAFAVEGSEYSVNYVACLRVAGFVFDDHGALVSATPAWLDILHCLVYSKSETYDSTSYKFSANKLSKCKVQILPTSLLESLPYGTDLSIQNLAQILFPKRVFASLSEIAVESDPIYENGLRVLLIGIERAICGRAADGLPCLAALGVTVANNRVNAPTVYSRTLLVLLNSMVVLQIKESPQYYMAIQPLFDADLPLQYLKALQPIVLGSLLPHLAYLGTALDKDATESIDHIVYKLFVEKNGYQASYHAPHEALQDLKKNLVKATFSFLQDVVPVREIFVSMFAHTPCNEAIHSPKGSKVLDLVLGAQGNQEAYHAVGLDFGFHSRTTNCTLGWNHLIGTLIAGIKGYEPEVALSTSSLCLEGLLDLQTCILDRTKALKATSLMNAFGVDTPAIDTLDDILQPETVAFLQALVEDEEGCSELNCEGVPICLSKVGFDFSKNSCQSLIGVPRDAFIFLSAAIASEIVGTETMFNPTVFAENIAAETTTKHTDIESLTLDSFVDPTGLPAENMGIPTSITTTQLLQTWPLVICAVRCQLGSLCSSLPQIAREAQSLSGSQNSPSMALHIAAFSCSPQAYSGMLFQIQRYLWQQEKGETLHNPHGLYYDTSQLEACAASLKMSGGEAFQCGLKTMGATFNGADTAFSNLPHLACLACSLHSNIGADYYSIPAAEGDLAKSAVSITNAISLGDNVVDPEPVTNALEGYFDPRKPPKKVELVRFLIATINTYFHEVEFNPDIQSKEDLQSTLNHVLPFTISFHKKMPPDAEHPAVDAAILAALVQNSKPLEYLMEYKENYAVLLGSTLGSTYRSCSYGNKCYPDMDFVNHKYLPFVNALSNGDQGASPQIFQAVGDILQYVDLKPEDLLEFLGFDFSKIGKGATQGLQALLPIIESLVGQ